MWNPPEMERTRIPDLEEIQKRSRFVGRSHVMVYALLVCYKCDLQVYKGLWDSFFPQSSSSTSIFWYSSFHSSKLSSDSSSQPSTYTMPVIANATRVWELNVHWAMYSQCGVWVSRGRGVDIWECIRDRGLFFDWQFSFSDFCIRWLDSW